MTQDDLGAVLGVKKAAVQKIESGRTNIGIDKFSLICKIFNVLPASLLFGNFADMWSNLYGIEVPSGADAMKDLELVARLDALAEARFGPKGLVLLKIVNELGDAGVDRAISYISDLAKIEEYRKSGKPE